MTITEYAKKIADKLANSPSNYRSILDEAERVINNSHLSDLDIKQFWIELYREYESRPRTITEKQGSSELDKIIDAAKAIIAKKAN
ncbi:TPA: hypothetical protein ACKRKP_000790 [Proteus mirabilis]|uniref:hypothetical protein n=1 Tax=Proteus mirabilis TaxID=584 RepID=UPI0005380535|nr:hypothetical protein [Proteus mirabilis]AUT91690.1 hypothetical protein MC46_008185 [Proteus mirabilis]MBG2891715.1 hypothetical protein [Proteus mirabilis]MBG2951642.1 hypothetical protein [Proteus mirabilis]MBG2973415.1 hypothetical protein [Proteus mirabilis]MBG5952276.1 hypothetical protein [Proteus mirabilis]